MAQHGWPHNQVGNNCRDSSEPESLPVCKPRKKILKRNYLAVSSDLCPVTSRKQDQKYPLPGRLKLKMLSKICIDS